MKISYLEVPRGFEFECCAMRAEKDETDTPNGCPWICLACKLVWQVDEFEERLRLVGHVSTAKAERFLEEWSQRKK
jgi:hypothetical protein